jgi:hypothetical protein
MQLLLEEPAEAFWGGGFSWRDPEGNIWDVAWAKGGTTIDERGGLIPVARRDCPDLVTRSTRSSTGSGLRSARRGVVWTPANRGG